MTIPPRNPNYVETDAGWERREDAPDVKTSRIDWSRYTSPERVEQMKRWAEEIQQDRKERNSK